VVCHHTKSDKFQEKEYIRAWDEAYTDVLDYYIEKVRYYAAAWLDTEAGKRFSAFLRLM